MKTLTRTITIIAVPVLLATTAWLYAGPLNPPAGPITSTGKTLSEVEPRIAVNATNTPGNANFQFDITQPGSYYLTGNITGVSGKGCIELHTGVTLDLNGFSLIGVPGSLSGVYINASRVVVRNGTIIGFNIGVDAYEADGARFQNLNVHNPTAQCFKASVSAVLENCMAQYGTIGFDVFESAVLTNCTSRYASQYGFEVEDGCTLTNCTTTRAEIGFFVHGPCVLKGCTSEQNTLDGYRVEESTVLTDCIALDNTVVGFYTIARCRVTRCTARDNQYGFFATEANAIVECTSSSNSAYGIYIDGNANTVERSTFHENTASGLYLPTGQGNSIDSNLFTYNGSYGVNVTSTDNLFVRNRARSNTLGNYMIGAGNDYGVLLSNPGAGFTSSAAWANFAY